MASRAEHSRCTVLLVNDDPEIRRLVKHTLSTERAQILTTGSGARALQIAARTPLSLVVLDAKLPDVNGTEILRRLRAIDADVPVIFVTSYGSPDSVRAAMELGAFDYLTMPVAGEDMSRIVREALASRGAAPILLRA